MIGVASFTKKPSKIGCLGLKSAMKEKVLGGAFWKVEIYPQTSIEPKYGEFYLKNEVSSHGLVLLVQLS